MWKMSTTVARDTDWVSLRARCPGGLGWEDGSRDQAGPRKQQGRAPMLAVSRGLRLGTGQTGQGAAHPDPASHLHLLFVALAPRGKESLAADV